MQTNISETFKSTRLAYGKSQKEFAEMIGCSRVSLSMYETGKIKNPGADKYDKLLKLKEQINQGPGPQAGPERTFHQSQYKFGYSSLLLDGNSDWVDS